MDYNEKQLTVIWLDSFDKISYKKKRLILCLSENIEEIFKNLSKFSKNIIDIIGNEQYIKLKLHNNLVYLKGIINEYNKKKIRSIPYLNEAYPKQLLELDDFPLVLYCRGNIELLNTNMIAVVGSRRPTRYGINVTNNFVSDIAKAGFTIVSGGARGIDTISHKQALNQKAKTIAVFGCGVDIIYPAENRALFADILENDGLLISEFIPQTPPNGYNFPQRNRIISGLATGVLVTEAGLKSGSMITVNCAVEQGKEIFLVPGNINSPMSKGTNEKLKTLQGAMVTEPKDILTHYKIELTKDEENNNMQLDFQSIQILELLRKEGEVHFEQILNAVDLNVNQLNTLLLEMQISGLIDRLAGNFYSAC